MKVQIKVSPGGLYNGAPITARVGDVVDLPDEYAAGLLAGGLAALVSQEEPVGDDDTSTDQPFPDGDPSGEWTAKQLKAWAKAHDVDLGGATRKDDILAALTETATVKEPDEQTATTDPTGAEQRPADEVDAEKRG